jgi:phage-related protein
VYKFRVEFLEEAAKFLENLDKKTRDKLYYNIWKARSNNDPELFKKLEDDIWEFRAKYGNKYVRLLAFWSKANKEDTLVIATNGFLKTTAKTPKAEIEKAKKLKEEYLTTTKEQP